MNNEEKILQILEQMQGDISGLKSDVGTLKSDVGTLKSDVGTLKSDVGTLKSDVVTLKSGFDQLNSKVEKNHEEVMSKINMHDAILASINADIRELTINQKAMKSDTTEELNNIKSQLDAVLNKVGDNSEELIKLNNSLEFLKLRQMDTEEQVHYLKKKIS